MTALLKAEGPPILFQEAKRSHAGRALHRVPTEIVRKALRDHITFAADENEMWYAAIALADGNILLMPSQSTLPAVAPDVEEKLLQVAILANLELNHGGHWVIFWDGSEMHAIWRDADGDLHILQAFPEPWYRLRLAPREYWVEVLDACWTKGMQMKAEIVRETGAKATFRAAQGEQPPSAARH